MKDIYSSSWERLADSPSGGKGEEGGGAVEMRVAEKRALKEGVVRVWERYVA